MMNENMNEINELNEKIVPLTEEELAEVAGGSHRYIEGDSGKSFVHTGPGLDYKRIGTLHRGEDARFLGETSIDERGVLWYKISWNGKHAWVSSRYTKKIRY
ncbi:MAG: SH3 domain-containing protein [Clostridia bacterium]|nr:SH3 domain-containing protein [Clostridia bacterium]MBR3273330.1 SH3 domain-containing protein [Clostridia bacterium]